MNPPDPASTLLDRARYELTGQFDPSKPFIIESAPGVLDVMGGITADYADGMACQLPIDRAAAVLLQTRSADRELQIFSFNLLDQHLPFTFRVSLDRLAAAKISDLAREFAEPGRRWAAHVAGCLYLLHERRLIDLNAADVQGIDLATYSTILENAELGASAAIQVATIKAVVNHFKLAAAMKPLQVAEIAQTVANRIAGLMQGIREPLTSAFGNAGEFLCLATQPSSIERSLKLPEGFQISWISTCRQIDVQRRNEKTRIATDMGQAMILSKMREFGKAAGRELLNDPMGGYLANLDPEDYKRFFRPSLPVMHEGYHIIGALDHHILEARRVRRFIEFIQQSRALPLKDTQRFILMDKAGHLMYASHQSYMNDAMLGDEQCDYLVQLVRQREKASLYGARTTGQGCGGSVAVLHEKSDRAHAALAEIVDVFQKHNDAAARLDHGA